MLLAIAPLVSRPTSTSRCWPSSSCFAIVAVSLDLIWGYAGILSIGHGVFFGLGAYAFGMYLKLEAAGDRAARTSWPGAA